jgi:hypothetical protein
MKQKSGIIGDVQNERRVQGEDPPTTTRECARSKSTESSLTV